MNISSVSDIVFDIILVWEYLRGSSVWVFKEDYYSPQFGNVSCAQYNSTASGQDVCVEFVKQDYWFAITTLFFIYLPSVNVIATLYGPSSVGRVAVKMSLVTALVGGVFALIGFFVTTPMSNPATSITGWFLIILSSGFLGMGLVNKVSGDFDTGGKTHLLHYIMFIPLVSISPVIFIVIKFLAIFKTENKLLQSQATYGSRGEGILEAAPQLGLQLYIVLLSLDPTPNQVLSILTSSATLSLPSIENFVAARGGDFGLKPIMKNVWILLPSSLFKILSVAIFSLFLRGWVIFIIVSTIVIVGVTLGVLMNTYYDLSYDGDDGDTQQFLECILLSWLTVAGLGSGKLTAINRLVSTLLVTILYSLTLGIIMAICNVNVNIAYIYVADILWSDITIVKETFFLNLLVGGTIALGWGAVLVDIIITWCKTRDWRSHNWGPLKKVVYWFVDPLDQEAGFWDEAVLLQGLGFKIETEDDDDDDDD